MSKDKKAPINSYRKTQFNTASPEKLLLLMYEGLLRYMKQVKKAQEDNDNAAKIESIDKARKVISELRRTLDFRVAEDIARNLDNLYEYMNRGLLETLTAKDCQKIDECIEITTSLFKSWQQAIANVKEPKPAEG